MKNATMTIRAALAASTILLAGPLLAQDDTVEAAEATAVAETSAPALWKVADEDTTIYLFGTVHALPEDVEWSTPALDNALASSDSIVTEIKMGPEIGQEMQSLVMAKGMLPSGTTLRSLLTDEQTASYEEALGKLSIPPAAFDQFEPWYAGMMMSMLPLLQQGYSPDAGVEKVLLTKAGDKEQQALETIEFQISVFDELPQDSQIGFLVEASEGVDEIKPMLDKMVAEWVEGDADALATLMNEGLTDPALAESLLYMRNRNWADWIDTRLETPGTVFIAVGAGHLAGDNSVQDYLAEREIETVRVQ
ncbi:hypothetical protein BPTFM16_00801 [Altererythrobacter insulae]|nr:hypothetical protein BPTFM16_00801 [Altererythrobacter insulae]